MPPRAVRDRRAVPGCGGPHRGLAGAGEGDEDAAGQALARLRGVNNSCMRSSTNRCSCMKAIAVCRLSLSTHESIDRWDVHTIYDQIHLFESPLFDSCLHLRVQYLFVMLFDSFI